MIVKQTAYLPDFEPSLRRAAQKQPAARTSLSQSVPSQHPSQYESVSEPASERVGHQQVEDVDKETAELVHGELPSKGKGGELECG